ncbi:hypothetical protein SESBI_18303 [Sesbania bispinosa]|nr:hypothetical protein SESBI_18303 [Sesbania bispinosa]
MEKGGDAAEKKGREERVDSSGGGSRPFRIGDGDGEAAKQRWPWKMHRCA